MTLTARLYGMIIRSSCWLCCCIFPSFIEWKRLAPLPPALRGEKKSLLKAINNMMLSQDSNWGKMGSAVNILPHGVWSEVLTHANCEFCQMRRLWILVPSLFPIQCPPVLLWMFILNLNISIQVSKLWSVWAKPDPYRSIWLTLFNFSQFFQTNGLLNSCGGSEAMLSRLV